MSDQSKIQWTDATWNPTTGCTQIAAGCAHCYIVTTPPFRIAGRKFVNGSTDIRLHGERLDAPLHWRKPRKVFVNSLSDLFHDEIPDHYIGRVFDTMALSGRHTFQVLTKRPERAAALIPALAARHTTRDGNGWPLRNVWIGTSIANQTDADKNIPALLRTPAKVRFLSVEPLLGPVTFRWAKWHEYWPEGWRERGETQNHLDGLRRIDWVIVGGESGPKARPCNVEWIESVVEECREAGVPVFVKQLGAKPMQNGLPLKLADRKGGDMTEWPRRLRVREFPDGATR